MNNHFPEIQPRGDIYIVNLHATNGNDFVPPEGADVLYTDEDRNKNIEELTARFSKEQPYRVHVKAGDGTVAWAIEAAVHSGQEVDISIRRGGYKNDLASMVSKAGGRIALRPLVLEKLRDEPDEGGNTWDLERMVAYSFGLGAVAVGAKIANSDEFREGKSDWIKKIARFRLPKAEALGSLIADIGLVKRILKPEATIGDQTLPTSVLVNGRRIGAMIVSNGQTMSGGGMRFKQKLHEQGFVTSWVGKHRSLKKLGMAFRLLGVHPKNDRWSRGGGESFVINEDTLAQADGEHFDIAKGTYRIRELGKTAVTLSVET